MKKIAISLILLTLCGCQTAHKRESGQWMSLFNGKDLTGWKAAENKECFTAENGTIKIQGGRGHLFYVGPVENANFKNFHFSAQVMTTPGSNSGIYFHTEYQESGWPDKGHECQVNITHEDPKKSGGLYNVQDTFKQHARDNQWYTQEIIVKDKHIVTKINGKVIADHIEAEGGDVPDSPGRILSSGTFALQAHDPKSITYFKDIKVKSRGL